MMQNVSKKIQPCQKNKIMIPFLNLETTINKNKFDVKSL